MAKRRKKLRRYELIQQPRFLTFSCYQRLPLFLNDRIKRAFVHELQRAREKTGFRLLAWVIMPEHVHLVIVPKLPEYPVKRVVAAIKQYFARRVIGRWKAMRAPILARVVAPDGSHRFWQHGGGYDRNPRDEAELWEKINYVHNNPVTRGLVNLPTDYLWSSARWYTGLRSHGLPAIDPLDV